MTHSTDEARALGRKYNHNKHVCQCTECIKLRMAKALDKIQKRAEAEGKIPMSKLIYLMRAGK